MHARNHRPTCWIGQHCEPHSHVARRVDFRSRSIMHPPNTRVHCCVRFSAGRIQYQCWLAARSALDTINKWWQHKYAPSPLATATDPLKAQWLRLQAQAHRGPRKRSILCCSLQDRRRTTAMRRVARGRARQTPSRTLCSSRRLQRESHPWEENHTCGGNRACADISGTTRWCRTRAPARQSTSKAEHQRGRVPARQSTSEAEYQKGRVHTSRARPR
jgi:hypothetical protein